MANKDSDDVTILLGDGRGHFRSAPSNRGGGLVTATPKGRLPTVTSGPFGDLNGDGKADIVTANSGDNDI
jgi:hypothetical protein